MTKVREPLSFALAINTVAGLIGWEETARITDRAVRTVRAWSESKHGIPTLAQAIELDTAYMQAGGQNAPLLESYARQLDVAFADVSGGHAALALEIANASREAGEAISFCIQAMQPGATPAMFTRAIREAEEADASWPRVIGRLKSFVPDNGVAGALAGGM